MPFRLLTVSMIALSGASAALAADVTARSVSTVRADQRSGRLVRVTAVMPRSVDSRRITPVSISPRVIGPAPASTAQPETGLSSLIDDAAKRHEVDPLLVHSVIRVESNYNPFAISPKGAEGLMQLIPSTARRFGVSNSFDARQNIEAGVKYLRYLQDLFQDDRLALAAYNAGEAAVMKYKDIPPYQETEQYVARVGKAYGQARRTNRQGQPASPPSSQPNTSQMNAGGPPEQAALQPAPEPLRGLYVSLDDAGRYVLRTR